ncbi:MAG: DUF4402 domain-containing protein, partial [Candidatus Wallbacteria bacterium]|nr:DUF4402 domain-containing protein [Candidatus Wallbacteria bacterium]
MKKPNLLLALIAFLLAVTQVSAWVTVNTIQQPLLFTPTNVVESPVALTNYTTTPQAAQTPGQAVGFTFTSNLANANFECAITSADPLNLTSGGNTIQVRNFRIGLNAPGAATFTGTTNGSGGYGNVIYIGATLRVPANAPSGTYTGTFTLRVRVQNGAWGNWDTTTVNYNISVTIVERMLLNKIRDLSFGSIATPLPLQG